MCFFEYSEKRCYIPFFCPHASFAGMAERALWLFLFFLFCFLLSRYICLDCNWKSTVVFFAKEMDGRGSFSGNGMNMVIFWSIPLLLLFFFFFFFLLDSPLGAMSFSYTEKKRVFFFLHYPISHVLHFRLSFSWDGMGWDVGRFVVWEAINIRVPCENGKNSPFSLSCFVSRSVLLLYGKLA